MDSYCTAHSGHCAGNEDRACIVEETISTILATVEMDKVLDRTATLLRRYFGQTRVALTRLSAEGSDEYEVLLVDDPSHPVPEPGLRQPVAGSVLEQVLNRRQTVVLEALSADQPRVTEERELATYGYGSLACIPLQVDDQILGTLNIAHPPRSGLLGHCLQAAQKMAQLVAIALHNSLLLDEVRRLNRLLDRENAYLKDQIRQARKEVQYIAESEIMRGLLDRVRMVAPSDSTVLIRGETGTGKEGLARLVHELSHRSAGPFVVVNLGAIPETLVESELFGHERGAFTGASRKKAGRFEQAQGGTLFLDEVGDAPLPVQVKLLRALQERQVEHLGGEQPIPVDVRVVAATNQPLEDKIEAGTFRSDLYYRLSTFPLNLPPLRDRLDDLRPLTTHLLARHAARMHRRPPAVPGEVWAALRSHAWPGNVRELENFLERALILSPGPVLRLVEHPGGGASRTAVAVEGPNGQEVLPFDASVREVLRQALAATDGKIYGEDGAAARLGLKPTTLQGKLRRYGVR